MLKINGVQVAEPKLEGLAIADEPIWSANTGRGSNGKMAGDIVAWKKTVKVEWNPLSFEEAKLIRDTIKNAGAFFQIEFNEFSDEETTTITVYASNIPRTMYSLVYQYMGGVEVTFIER